MEKKTMMAAAGLTAATMAVAAGVAAGTKGKNTRKMKKMAKKVARSAPPSKINVSVWFMVFPSLPPDGSSAPARLLVQNKTYCSRQYRTIHA